MGGAKRQLNLKVRLTLDERATINALLDTPSAATWEAAREIIVAFRPEPVTLADAIAAICLIGFHVSPDPFSVRRALRFAARI